MTSTGRPARSGRLSGLVLIVFGLSGLAVIGASGVLALRALDAVNGAAADLERQRGEILAVLGPASAALSDAADSASHAGASLTETGDAARRASALTTRLATSFDGLAALGAFEILGTRPFGGLATQFADVATESRLLSADLGAAADAMATNITDTAAVAEDLQALADQVGRLEASLRATDADSISRPGGIPIAEARFVLAGLLAWLALLALGIAGIGLRRIAARSPGVPPEA